MYGLIWKDNIKNLPKKGRFFIVWILTNKVKEGEFLCYLNNHSWILVKENSKDKGDCFRLHYSKEQSDMANRNNTQVDNHRRICFAFHPPISIIWNGLLKWHYFLITTYIKKYNLQPHEALAKWLENRQKRNKN